MRTGSAFVLAWVTFAAAMTLIGIAGGLPAAPIHAACQLIDPPSDLELWKHSR